MAIPELLTYKQAAEVLGCSELHVGDLARRGALPRVKFGRHMVRIRREDLDQFISEHIRYGDVAEAIEAASG